MPDNPPTTNELDVDSLMRSIHTKGLHDFQAFKFGRSLHEYESTLRDIERSDEERYRAAYYVWRFFPTILDRTIDALKQFFKGEVAEASLGHLEDCFTDLHRRACHNLAELAVIKSIDPTAIYLGGQYCRILLSANSRDRYDCSQLWPTCISFDQLNELPSDVRTALFGSDAMVESLRVDNAIVETQSRRRRQKPCEERDLYFLRLYDQGKPHKTIAAEWNRSNANDTVTEDVVKTAVSRLRNNM